MCSIGWLRVNDVWYFFKNRDRKPGEPVSKNNIFVQDEDIAALANKLRRGITTGINKYGIAIMTSGGPRNISPPGKLTDSAKVSEQILRTCKTLKSAKERYKKLAKDFGYNYNVIIADSKSAYSLEITAEGVGEERSNNYLVRTNHFENLKKFNKDEKSIKVSKLRYKKLRNLIKKAKGLDDIFAILQYHAGNEFENICRHGQSTTVDPFSATCASVIFEVNGKKVTAYYVLNSPPCKRSFTTEEVGFKLK